MKTQKTTILLIILAMVSSLCYSQPKPPGAGGGGSTKLKSGDVKMLKGQTSLTVQFTYENLMVGEMTEEAYVTKKVNEKNKEKAGSGDEWASKWKNDRSARFEPEFIDGFNKSIKKLGIVAVAESRETPTPYTLIIQTDKVEPGFYTGVSFVEKDTYITLKATLVDSADPTKVLALIELNKIVGSAFDVAKYDTGLKISNAYNNAGKDLASLIVKNCK